MDIVNLDEYNIDEYNGYITPDVAENIGRTFFRGILALDEGKPVAGMIWEIRNMMGDAENISRIIWLKADSEDAAEDLFERYRESVITDDVVRSDFSLPAKTDSRETEILKKEGFDVKFMEGDLIKVRLSEIMKLPFIKKV